MNKVTMILLCSLVTMAARIIPQFISSLDKLPRVIKKAMLLLPTAALGSLIFPLALTDFGSSWYAGLGGVVIAFIAGHKRTSMIVAIILALIATMLLLLI